MIIIEWVRRTYGRFAALFLTFIRSLQTKIQPKKEEVMFKGLLLRGVLCTSLIVLFGVNAHAYPAVVGGWGATPKCVCVWTDWKSVANYELSPTDVTVTLLITKVKLHYLNPGGQPGGDGVPFYPNVEIPLEGTLDDYVSKNGRYQMLLCFEDNLLLEYIQNSGVDIPEPPNPAWTLDPEHAVIVLEMKVWIKGYSDLNGDLETETETAHIGGPCTLNYENTDYTCVTEEEWLWDKKYPENLCPYED